MTKSAERRSWRRPIACNGLRKAAAEDRATINQLIKVAVAEKLAVLRARRWFEERAARGAPKKALEILRSPRPRPAASFARRVGHAGKVAPQAILPGYSLRISLIRAIASSTACSGLIPSAATRPMAFCQGRSCQIRSYRQLPETVA